MTRRVAMCLFAGVLAALAGGCNATWHFIEEPVTDRVLEAHSGDRWYVKLNEDFASGWRWKAKSDDPDVTFEYKLLPPPEDEDGNPGKINVREICIRIHRGYDGPSYVTLSYVKPSTGEVGRKVSFFFYRRTGDVAPWK